jgi:hypothetical protein
LFSILTFPYFAAEIMTKFSARFDAKAAKDAKGKGKVNPSGNLSQGVAEGAAASEPSVGVKAVSAVRGSPLAGKTTAVLGTKKGGDLRLSKRARITHGKNDFFLPF